MFSKIKMLIMVIAFSILITSCTAAEIDQILAPFRQPEKKSTAQDQSLQEFMSPSLEYLRHVPIRTASDINKIWNDIKFQKHLVPLGFDIDDVKRFATDTGQCQPAAVRSGDILILHRAYGGIASVFFIDVANSTVESYGEQFYIRRSTGKTDFGSGYIDSSGEITEIQTKLRQAVLFQKNGKPRCGVLSGKFLDRLKAIHTQYHKHYSLRIMDGKAP